MRLRVVAKFGMLLISAFVADSALAQDIVSQPQSNAWFSADEPAHVLAYFSGNVASPAEVNDAVGDLHFYVNACKNSRDYLEVRRELTVGIQRANYESPGVIDALLFQAVQHAWDECPLHFINVVTGIVQPGYRREITAVHVYYNGKEVVSASHLCCDWGDRTGHDYYRWGQVTDVGAIARQEAARQQSFEESRTAREEWNKIRDERSAAFWGSVGSFIELIFAGFCCYGLWRLRVRIARWYYFAFHPHPATELVERTIAEGAVPLNGKALASAISEMPPGGRILRQVRMEQGETLIKLMREATRERLARYEKQTKHEYERAAIASIQEAIGLAAIALERAKASFAASQNLRG